MLRVLQLPDSDPQLFSKELKNFEVCLPDFSSGVSQHPSEATSMTSDYLTGSFQVESLFTAYDERRSCKVKFKCVPDASSICGAAEEDRTQENNVVHEESVSSSATNR